MNPECIDTKQETKKLTDSLIVDKIWMCILESKQVKADTSEMEKLLENLKLDSDIIDGDQNEIEEPQTELNQVYPILSQTLKSRLKRRRLTLPERNSYLQSRNKS